MPASYILYIPGCGIGDGAEQNWRTVFCFLSDLDTNLHCDKTTGTYIITSYGAHEKLEPDDGRRAGGLSHSGFQLISSRFARRLTQRFDATRYIRWQFANYT